MTSPTRTAEPAGDPVRPDVRPGRRPLSDWVLAQLYEFIFSGKLAPGDSLGEVEITELLGVSRSPIRDALRQLEDGGLVDVSATNGRRTVRRFGIDDVYELYTIRMSLESLAVGHAAKSIPDTALRQIEGYLAQMGRLAHAPVLPGHDFQADFQFHEAICSPAGLPRLMRLLQGVWLQTRALLHHLDMARVYPTGDELSGVVDDHAQILARLRERDAAASEAAVRQHLRLRRDHLIEALRLHGGIA